MSMNEGIVKSSTRGGARVEKSALVYDSSPDDDAQSVLAPQWRAFDRRKPAHESPRLERVHESVCGSCLEPDVI